MTLRRALRFALFVAGLCLASPAAAFAAGLIDGGPNHLSDTRTLGQVIAQATDHPVHIIYVHGIRAEGPGFSLIFRQGICKYVPGACGPEGQPPRQRSDRFDLGTRPQATFVNTEIWKNDTEWAGSRPFVDRYVFKRAGAQPIIVDEVNWWPLLFPLKCRLLIKPEVALSGADKDHLQRCAGQPPSSDPIYDGVYYPWISNDSADPDNLQALLARKPLSGGGASLNATLKQQLLNFGLSDAVVTLGPMKEYVRTAMDRAFAYAGGYDGKTVDEQEFVVISESLGSFVVMDSFGEGDTARHAVRDVMSNTADLYFFANQFALLEIGRISIQPAAPPAGGGAEVGPPAGGGAAPAPTSLLEQWASTPPKPRGPPSGGGAPSGGAPPSLKQVIAFNDPSDALTYDVPALTDRAGRTRALVVNVYDRNEWLLYPLIVDPLAAHTGHSGNACVLKAMFAGAPVNAADLRC